MPRHLTSCAPSTANFGGPPSALLQLSGMVQQQPLASLTSLELAMRQSHPCSTTRDSMSRLIESQPELARLWLLACRMSTGQSPGVLSPRLLCSVAAADLPGALGGLVSVLASGLRIASHFYEDCREDPDRAPLPCMELFLHMGEADLAWMTWHGPQDVAGSSRASEAFHAFTLLRVDGHQQSPTKPGSVTSNIECLPLPRSTGWGCHYSVVLQQLP